MELSQDVQHRPMVFIRFNPDGYTNDKGEKVSTSWEIDKRGICKVKKSRQDEWRHRLNTLKETLEYWIENRTNKTIEIVQLYYDMNI
jgi:hypothetical protein